MSMFFTKCTVHQPVALVLKKEQLPLIAAVSLHCWVWSLIFLLTISVSCSVGSRSDKVDGKSSIDKWQQTRLPKSLPTVETSHWASNNFDSMLSSIKHLDFQTNANFIFIWSEDFGRVSNSPTILLLKVSQNSMLPVFCLRSGVTQGL